MTSEEKVWLEAHPVITIAFDGDYAPYSFLNEKGEFRGIAVDVSLELAETRGNKTQYLLERDLEGPVCRGLKQGRWM